MRLRPHHLLDIITQYGQDRPFEPSPYGHAVHTVAGLVLANPGLEAEMVAGADDICAPCLHLVGGRCDDMVGSLDPPVSKQEYNDDLDRRVLAYLSLAEGEVLTIRAFAERSLARLEGLAGICTHPKEDPARRREGLEAGLRRLLA